MIIWNGDRKYLINDISTSDWKIPLDHTGRVLPMEIKRVANLMGMFAVVVHFVETRPQC
jgi:hypothetical protein